MNEGEKQERNVESGIFISLLLGEFYSVQTEEAPVRNKIPFRS